MHTGRAISQETVTVSGQFLTRPDCIGWAANKPLQPTSGARPVG